MRKKRALRTLVEERGYVHRADLIDAGWRPDAIRSAVAAEKLVRAGRQWILLPDAGEDLHLAASTGSTLTCVTAAAREELWMPEKSPLTHLAVPPGTRRGVARARTHWARPVVSRLERSLTDPIENVLALVAVCQTHEFALTVWDSALRSRKTTLEDLHAVTWPGEQARRLLREATARSHSGLETRFCTRMRRIGVAVRQQVEIAGHRVDALVGRRVVVQLDGFAHHSDPAQRRADIAHDRALQRLGYIVLRFDYHEVMNEWDRVQAAVLQALLRD